VNRPFHPSEARDRNLMVGIDVGGTFTDVVAIDTETGAHWSLKTPTTSTDQSAGFIDGIAKITDMIGTKPASIVQLLHGTTVATNAILEGKGASAALLTTEGFRHVLEIGRHDIPRKANMFSWIKPKRPVPPRLIFEVAGRIDVDGNEHTPLDEDAVRIAAEEIARQGIDAVAICLLHSYANPSHEARVRDILLERMPDALISLSSEVLPVFREFERSMVTILNAYVMAPVARYVGRLDSRLQEAGVATPLLLMNSSGGVVGSTTARREPVQTALSGPAAGVLGAASIGVAAGHPNLITIDIGGTSADVCLIKDGRPAITKRGRIGNWPVHTPMVDMETIGAGGGSIARVSAGGSLAVGPESAGAEPGPACYGRGGTLPTVTDAHLALGRLCDSLLDDSLGLDREAANDAIKRAVADPLGMTIERAAEGILEVVNNAMVGAIRLVSVERGHNPRDFTLLGFGGAGPLHSTALARLLGMSTVIVPPSPGVLSAIGLTVADIRNDFSRTCLERPPHYDLRRIEGVFRELNAQALDWLEAEGIPEAARNVEWEASFRYRNQGFELTVPWNGTDVSEASLESAFAAFHRVHEQLYTFCQPDTPIEVVTLHVTAIGRLSRPTSATRNAPAGGSSIVGSQKLYTGGEWVDCPIHARDRLSPEARILGPAIIKQHDTTTVLEEGQIATVHQSGMLIVSLGSKS
jgi:N-methylhydantoinase A